MPLELLARELGDMAGRIEREMRLKADAIREECSRAIAEVRQKYAETELENIRLRERLSEEVASRLALVKDGPQGPIGLAGPVGPEGPAGKDGCDGEAGPVGPQGERGEVGPQGERGADGLQGERGEIGPQGERGETGERGSDGAPGERGADGLQGERGETGPQGERGETGERGADGAPGERGTDGLEGPAGRDAVQWMPRGLFKADEVYRAFDVVAFNGSAWVAKTDDPGEPGQSDAWMLLAKQGKRGEPGRSGERGDPGPQGPTGASLDDLTIEGETLIATKSDGSTIAVDLYTLLSKRG